MKKPLFLLLLFGFSANLSAQVALAPTAIFLDKNGLGTLYVSNNSGQPQEISITFQFGYTDQNEIGNLVIRYDDTSKLETNGIVGIKAFPRTFILPPGQQQLVRLQARFPKGKADGMYFTRLKVGSQAKVADVGDQTSSDGISTRVNVRFEQVIVCFYKYGAVKAGVEIMDVKTKLDSNLVTFTTMYRTTGNSPYLGRVKTVLKDASGKVIMEYVNTSSLYFSGKRNFVYERPKNLTPGKYFFEQLYETVRSDIPMEDLVTAPPYQFKKLITID